MVTFVLVIGVYVVLAILGVLAYLVSTPIRSTPRTPEQEINEVVWRSKRAMDYAARREP